MLQFAEKMDKVRRNASIYFAVQGVSVGLWWLMMVVYPATRTSFRLDAVSETSLYAFWLGDLMLIAPGSIAAAALLWKRSVYATSAMWIVTGAVSQATFYTLAYVFQTDHGWIGVALMLPCMLWSGVFATSITVSSAMFRKAKRSTSKYILTKTFTQIAIVWSLILLIFPLLITFLEDKIGITRFQFPFQKPIAVLIFVAISSIGIWSAIVMSRLGKGTPLPLDHATEMVVAGPYAYVRNPMALSGIGQGLAVALFLGSPLVAVYALTGSAIWQFIFRPLEEEDLAKRFGQQFEEYRGVVKCWIPSRYQYRKISDD